MHPLHCICNSSGPTWNFGSHETMLLMLLFAKCSTKQLNKHTFGCTSSAWKNTAGMITNTCNYKTPLKPTKNFGTLNETGLFASEAKTRQIDKQWPKCVNKSINHWCKTQHVVGYITATSNCFYHSQHVFSKNNLDLMTPKPHWFLSCNLHCTPTINILCFFWRHPEFETWSKLENGYHGTTACIEWPACCSKELCNSSMQ